MKYKHKIMPDADPGIDCGDDLPGFLSKYGAERSFELIKVGVAEKFRQNLAKAKAKAKDGKLTEEQTIKVCAWTPLDLELPKEAHEGVVASLLALTPEQRAKALQKAAKALKGGD